MVEESCQFKQLFCLTPVTKNPQYNMKLESCRGVFSTVADCYFSEITADPDQDFLHDGADAHLNCTLTNYKGMCNSSCMYFKLSTTAFYPSSPYVTILSTRSLHLHYPNVSLDVYNNYHFWCRLNETVMDITNTNQLKWISSKSYKIGSKSNFM